MDSIRNELTKNDMIETIRMELAADIDGKKPILLVEGSDDVQFSELFFNSAVICYESFSGKRGLHELIEESSIADYRVIAVRDKDYSDESTYPDRMFAYDTSCLELMLLQSKDAVKRFHVIYYKGKYSEDDFIINAMRRLEPYSLLRKKNEKEGLKIEFKKFGDLIKSEDELDIEKLFLRVRVPEHLLTEFAENVQNIAERDLFEISNGHDVYAFLGKFSENAKKPLGEAGVRNAMMAVYQKRDFERTELYNKIKRYQRRYGLKYVD